MTRIGLGVRAVEIPPGGPHPTVIVWADRSFVQDPYAADRYIEAYSWTVPLVPRTPGHRGECECRACGGSV